MNKHILENPIIKEFLIESNENLSSIVEEFQSYLKNTNSVELIKSLFRKIHTLKGSASFLGFQRLESLTHLIESLLELFKEQHAIPNEQSAEVILDSFYACQDLVKAIEEIGTEGTRDLEVLKAKLTKQIEIYKSNSSNTPIVLEQLENIEINPKVEAQAELHIGLEHEAQEHLAEDDITNISSIKKDRISNSSVRVDVKLLDKMMNIVGELVLNRNQILQLSKHSEDAELNRLSHQLNVITTELQTDIMTTRMQPLSTVLNQYTRMVRELGRSQNKKVQLQVTGQETELDKSLLEIIKDPITHILRNAIDHGLEETEDRLVCGKKAEGKINIKAYHLSGQVVIEISDDGRGINAKRVAEKAINKGLYTEEDISKLHQDEILKLIFLPGFSTADKVTNISGRGVGMDVVKSNIERIGGQVDLTTVLGKGTSFRIKIPLTLAIVPALLVMSGEQHFAIPQKNLVELVLLNENEFHKLEKIHNSEFYRLRGNLIPILRLNGLLKIESKKVVKHFENIVVLSLDSGVFGLIVDDILDTQEIVVKPLSHKIKNNEVYAGATIMGNGHVSLILDAMGLFKMKGQLLKNSDKDAIQFDYNNEKNVGDKEELLLFTLKDKREYAIPLCLIERLEEFPDAVVERSGKQRIVKYRGLAMPLIDLNRLAQDQSEVLEEEKLDCLVCKIEGASYGFIVNKILDIIHIDSSVDQENSDNEYFMGTAYASGKLITVVDIHQLIWSNKLRKKQDKIHSKAHVVIAEDSILYRRVLQELLESNGYKVNLFENGQDALEFAKKTKVDLIISDVEMPLMNGFEFCQSVRKMLSKDLPFIALTTRFNSDDKAMGEKAGFTKHLQKLNRDEVLRTVEICLKNKDEWRNLKDGTNSI